LVDNGHLHDVDSSANIVQAFYLCAEVVRSAIQRLSIHIECLGVKNSYQVHISFDGILQVLIVELIGQLMLLELSELKAGVQAAEAI